MPITANQTHEYMRFNIGDVEFASTRIKPLTLIHLARRLAPIILVLKSLQSAAGSAPLDIDPGDPVPGKPIPNPPPDLGADKWLPALVEAVAELSDDDANYVVRECLSVTRQVRPMSIHKELWWAERQRPVEELTAGEILMIVGKVLGKTFMDLMEELPTLGVGDFKTEMLGNR